MLLCWVWPWGGDQSGSEGGRSDSEEVEFGLPRWDWHFYEPTPRLVPCRDPFGVGSILERIWTVLVVVVVTVNIVTKVQVLWRLKILNSSRGARRTTRSLKGFQVIVSHTVGK